MPYCIGIAFSSSYGAIFRSEGCRDGVTWIGEAVRGRGEFGRQKARDGVTWIGKAVRGRGEFGRQKARRAKTNKMC